MNRKRSVRLAAITSLLVIIAVLLSLIQPYAAIRATGLPIHAYPWNTAAFSIEADPTTVALVRISDSEIERLEKDFKWRSPDTVAWYDGIPWYSDLVSSKGFARLLKAEHENGNPEYEVTNGGSGGARWSAVWEIRRNLVWIVNY